MLTVCSGSSGKPLPLMTVISLGLKLLKSPRFPSSKEIDLILGQAFQTKKLKTKSPKVNLSQLETHYAPSDSLLSILVTLMLSLEGLPGN
jgi:hypothetical protein